MPYSFPTSIYIDTLWSKIRSFFWLHSVLHQSINHQEDKKHEQNRTIWQPRSPFRCRQASIFLCCAHSWTQNGSESKRHDGQTRQTQSLISAGPRLIWIKWRCYSWPGISNCIDYLFQFFRHPFPAAIVWQNHTLDVSFHEFFHRSFCHVFLCNYGV